VTLIELLVVISIVVVLAAVTMPTIRPALESRRIREATRSLTAYIGSARNRALESGRSSGVAIQRFAPDLACAMVVDQVEVPAPYGGDDFSAKAKVQVSGNALQAQLSAASLLGQPKGVTAGDLIQFNYQGPFFPITSIQGSTVISDSAQWRFQLSAVPPAWGSPNTSVPVPYKILRRPSKSQATPLQLPAGAVIDLEFSGTDAGPTATLKDAAVPIIIVFSPNGAVERVYYNDQAYPATQPIYLLVGKRERVPSAQAERGIANWRDLDNLWITLNPQTGLVTSNKIAVAENNSTGIPQNLLESREYARSAGNMGGR
jgi:type II secretory pathway pseudopilin PulG